MSITLDRAKRQFGSEQLVFVMTTTFALVFYRLSTLAKFFILPTCLIALDTSLYLHIPCNNAFL